MLRRRAERKGHSARSRKPRRAGLKAETRTGGDVKKATRAAYVSSRAELGESFREAVVLADDMLGYFS
jgi:hypothetical protein